MLNKLDLDDGAMSNVISALEEYDGETFFRCTELIKNNVQCYRYTNFAALEQLSDEEYQKALQFAKASDMPVSLDFACKVAKLDDGQYSRLKEFKTQKGRIYEPEYEKISKTDDIQFARVLSLIELFGGHSEYICPIAFYDKACKNTLMMAQAGVFDNVINWQERYTIAKRINDIEFRDGTNSDTISERLIGLSLGGLNIKSASDVQYATLRRLYGLNSEQFENAILIAKSKITNKISYLFGFACLDKSQLEIAKEMLQLGFNEYFAIFLSKNDSIRQKVTELINLGMSPKSISSEIKKLDDEKIYQRIKELARAGADNFWRMYMAQGSDDEQFNKAKELVRYRVPGYDFVRGSKLSGDDYLREIKNLELSRLNYILIWIKHIPKNRRKSQKMKKRR